MTNTQEAARRAPGTVVRYTPDPTRFNPHWCREGLAIADADGRLVDTYWEGGSEAHVLTGDEAATAEVLFHLDDYRELDPGLHQSRVEWQKYRPQDRRTITSQHRLSRRYFVRKGAEPDLGTQIENAQQALADAIVEAKAAEDRVRWRRQELAELEAQR